MDKIRKIAIVGLGPRGLWALENLVKELYSKDALVSVELLLFEERAEVGSSSVYDTKQAHSNWINLTERLIDIAPRAAIDFGEMAISSFPNYKEWMIAAGRGEISDREDRFPPRKLIGQYLHERAKTLCDDLESAGVARVIHQRVTDLDYVDYYWRMTTTADTFDGISEVLLTIGHQPTTISPQVDNWAKAIAKYEEPQLFTSPYPLVPILEHLAEVENPTIAIRGFGLAMMDVCRAIALQYGHFSSDANQGSSQYELTNHRTFKIVPFSLDGLPMAPKPLNRPIDMAYAPDHELLFRFEKEIANARNQREADSADFLIRAFVRVAKSVYTNFGHVHVAVAGHVEKAMMHWLRDSDYSNTAITDKSLGALHAMKSFVEMAKNKSAISLDYFLGQVWRHCQPAMYRAFEYNQCKPHVIHSVVALDERLKRYSYGPPVEAIDQLLALAEKGLLATDVLNDPDIDISEQGWTLKGDQGTAITAQVMVDSVLSAPELQRVNSTLVLNLKKKGYVTAKHGDLGIDTGTDAYAVDGQSNQNYPLAVVGRLAKGTLLGVDALLECFGHPPVKWAKRAAANQKASLQE